MFGEWALIFCEAVTPSSSESMHIVESQSNRSAERFSLVVVTFWSPAKQPRISTHFHHHLVNAGAQYGHIRPRLGMNRDEQFEWWFRVNRHTGKRGVIRRSGEVWAMKLPV